MRFHIRAIKEVYQQEYNLDIIIQCDDEKQLQSFLHDTKMLSISTEAYTGETKEFWDIYGSIHWHDADHDFVIKEDNIQSALRTMMIMWLSLSAINSYASPLDIQDAVSAIKNISKEVEEIRSTKESQIQEKIDISQSTYTDASTTKIQTFVTKVLQDADFAIQKYSEDTEGIKKIQNHINELKKMRLSKNGEKLEEIIHKIYSSIEWLEETYLSKLPDEEIVQWSVITVPFFVRLYDTWERAKKLHSIGVHLHGREYIYAYLGRNILIATLVYKEIFASIQQQRKHTNKIIQTTILTVMLAIVCVCIIGLYTHLVQTNSFDLSTWHALLVWWILWVSLQLWWLLAIKKNRHTNIILLISIAMFICLGYIFRWLLILY